MKKKIINGFLVAALLIGSTSAFVSCKDYEEDNLVAITDKLTSLDEALKTQKQWMETEVGNLKIAQAACEARCKTLRDTLSNFYLKSEVYNKTEADQKFVDWTTYNTFLGGYEGTAKQLSDAIIILQNRLNKFNGTDETIEEAISNNNQAIIAARAIAEQALNLAQQDSMRIDTLAITVSQLKGTLNQTISRLNQIAFAWSDSLKTAYGNAVYAKNLADNNKKSIDSLRNRIKYLEDHPFDDTALNTRINNLIDSLNGELNKYATKDSLNALATRANDWFKKAKATADSALTLAVANRDSILKINGRLEGIDGRLNGIDLRIGELEEGYKVADSLLQVQIDSLKKEVKVLKEKIDNITTRIYNIEQNFNKQITQVIVNATENPIIGYLNTPANIKTLMLAAWYGKTYNGFDFPSTSDVNYVEAGQVFTASDLQVMGLTDFSEVSGYVKKKVNERFVAEVNGSTTGNAGTVYVTINPSNVNYQNGLKLVNSQNEASSILLSDVQRSDRVLDFGYTYAARTRAAENGFYEAKATLEVDGIDDAKIKKAIDFETMKNTVKAVIDERSTGKLLRAAYEMLQGMSNVLPAYAVQASWTSQIGVENKQTVHNLNSDYSVAATAIHPLSFNTLKDLETESFTFPMLDRIEEMTGEIVRRINITIPQLSTVKFVDVTFAAIPGTTPADALNMTVSATYQLGEDASTRQTMSFPMHTTMTAAEIADLSASIGANFVDLMNSLYESNQLTTSIDTSISSVQNVIEDWVITLNKRLARALQSSNKALQPTLIASANKKVARVSGNPYSPTWVLNETEVELTPTSWTLELFAPAYKKFIAVTDVFNSTPDEYGEFKSIKNGGVAQYLANNANAGENMKKVIDGDTTVKFTGKPGHIYEIAYSAVDYYGKIVTRRFYIGFYESNL